MAFRDQVVAAAARAETLETQLVQERERANRAETHRRKLLQQLDLIQRGVSREQALRNDAHFAIGQVLLPVAGFLGLLYLLGVYGLAMRPLFYGSFDPSFAGLANLMQQVDSAETLLAVGLGALTLALSGLPWLAALGLLRRRRWGWTVGAITWSLWLAAFPPLGLYGLYALCRSSVREHFYPTFTAVLDPDPGSV